MALLLLHVLHICHLLLHPSPSKLWALSWQRLGSWLLGNLEGRADLTPLNVGKLNLGERLNLPNGIGEALGSIARSSTSSGTVKPLHGSALVPPDGHGENHTAGHGIAHLNHTTEAVKPTLADDSAAVFRVHEVDWWRSSNVDTGVVDEPSVLDVQAADLLELAVLVGRELSDDGEWPGGVDISIWSVVVGVAELVGVVSAAPLVAKTLEGAVLSLATEETWLAAWMRSNVAGPGIGLPDVQLVTARSLLLNVGLYE